jgi:hypothetical protein
MMATDIDELGQAAKNGDRAAMTALGKLGLVGRAGERSLQDAAALLASAAEAGDAEADAVIAALIAADARALPDWGVALGYLERAARRGWSPAQRQLALFCSDRDLAERSLTDSAPVDIWRSVREQIDVSALIRPASARVAFEGPHVGIIEHFATPAECAWMIERARPNVARARVFDRERGGVHYDDARTNSAVQFNILDADFVLLILQARIAAAAGVTPRHLEEANVLHYAPGQEFRKHYDFFESKQPFFEQEIAEKGQRTMTFLTYLNEGFEGGETEFVKLGWRHKGRPGDALMFRNTDSSGVPDTRTLHAGLPPLSGEKWLLSQWIRSRAPRRPGEGPSNPN